MIIDHICVCGYLGACKPFYKLHRKRDRMNYEKQHELNDIREVIRRSFAKTFGETFDEELVYLGGSKDIAHCGYLIFNEKAHETIVEFQVSSYGIYSGKLNTVNTYYLRKFLDFKEMVQRELEND